MLGIKPITTALPIPSSPLDTACFLSTSLATFQAASVSWVGASCRWKCGEKDALIFLNHSFFGLCLCYYWLNKTVLKQNNQVKMSHQLPLPHNSCMSCALYKFKFICRTLQAWKVGQWKNGSRDNNNNIALSEGIQIIAIVRKMPPDFVLILNWWHKISSSTSTSVKSTPVSNSPKNFSHKNLIVYTKI